VVTIKEIAARVGKTEATVSLALNNKPGVGDATRRRIKEVALEMGYMPNIIARELSTQVSLTVGLIVPDLGNPFFAAFSESVNRALTKNGYKMMLAISNQSVQNEHAAVADMISRRVDGIIIVPVTEETGQISYRDLLQKSGIPYIFATSYYPSWDAPRVMSDLVMGERIAFDYLLKVGHRRILFLGTNPLSPPNSLRIAGIYQACEKLGFDADAIIDMRSVESPDFDRAYSFARELLNQGRLAYTAIATLNDIMAIGVMKALTEFGYRVPQDVSLMGFDNLIFSEIATVPLSTIEQDIDKLAGKSVEAIIEGRGMEAGCIHIHPKLILRSSTATVPTKA